MRLKTIKTVQVKCNFCFDWMRLNTQTRLNINVCDQCLTKASGPSTLSAVSSNGEIYQFYMVKKNTNISTLKEENHLTNWLENYQRYDDQNLQNTQENLKTEFLEDIDQYRNAQIQQILLKWGLLTNFFNEKQELSNQDVQYLKKMCSQYINEHKKINQKLIESVTVEQFPKQIQVNFLKNQLKMQREPLSEIKILDHSNLNIAISKTSEHNMKKIYQMKNQITQSIIFTSPKKNLRALVQKENQQKFEINAYSVQKQQSNQRTFHQDFSKLEYQFSDYDSSLNSSSITQSDLYLPLGEMKSSRHSLFLTTVTKRSKQQLLKTYELIRNRISKYLLQKYESSSLTRLMFNMVFEAFQNTSTIGKSLQLVAYNLSFLDFGCYLQAFDWSTVQIVKLVKVKLKDEQLKILVQFLYVKNISIKTLVLTGNKLTQKSLSYFQSHKIDGLQQIYLGKNRIKKFQVRRNIASLRENYRLHL